MPAQRGDGRHLEGVDLEGVAAVWTTALSKQLRRCQMAAQGEEGGSLQTHQQHQTPCVLWQPVEEGDRLQRIDMGV